MRAPRPAHSRGRCGERLTSWLCRAVPTSRSGEGPRRSMILGTSCGPRVGTADAVLSVMRVKKAMKSPFVVTISVAAAAVGLMACGGKVNGVSSGGPDGPDGQGSSGSSGSSGSTSGTIVNPPPPPEPTVITNPPAPPLSVRTRRRPKARALVVRSAVRAATSTVATAAHRRRRRTRATRASRGRGSESPSGTRRRRARAPRPSPGTPARSAATIILHSTRIPRTRAVAGGRRVRPEDAHVEHQREPCNPPPPQDAGAGGMRCSTRGLCLALSSPAMTKTARSPRPKPVPASDAVRSQWLRRVEASIGRQRRRLPHRKKISACSSSVTTSALRRSSISDFPDDAGTGARGTDQRAV